MMYGRALGGDKCVPHPKYIPLVVKKRHTCFFCAFGSPSTLVESAVISAMLDIVPEKSLFLTTKFLET
jgi:hypothetical protein